MILVETPLDVVDVSGTRASGDDPGQLHIVLVLLWWYPRKRG